MTALLHSGADPNIKDLNKNSPLHLLCKTVNWEAIPNLIDESLFEVDLVMKDSQGNMAF
jgi:ankyrin repeat protein